MDNIEAVQVMTHPTRFQLMQLLGRHPYCVKALAKKLGISESAVSQHMNVLKKYGIVSGVRMGYPLYNRRKSGEPYHGGVHKAAQPAYGAARRRKLCLRVCGRMQQKRRRGGEVLW